MKYWYKNDTLTQNINYFFNTIRVMKDRKQRFYLYNESHNYKATCLGPYFTQQKAIKIETLFEQIINYALIRALL